MLEHFEYLFGSGTAGDMDRQSLQRVLIDHRQTLQLLISHQWAAEIRDVVSSLMGSGTHRLAIDRADLEGADALRAQGFALVEGQRLLELARSVKSAEEIACMRRALAIADIGMHRMRDFLRPGMTEIELWAELHHTNIVHGDEWIEARLLSSGPRTNPWFQEASDRIIEAGDLVSFDTDMIGPYGYCSDVSRSFSVATDSRRTNRRASIPSLSSRSSTTATCSGPA